MPDTNDITTDIDALLRYLKSGHTPHWYDDSTRWRAALTALVAERDALRDEMTRVNSYWRKRAERRDAEQRQAADRDLRERDDAMVEWMMKATTMLCDARRLHQNECWELVSHRDAAIAAMRKGDTNGK